MQRAVMGLVAAAVGLSYDGVSASPDVLCFSGKGAMMCPAAVGCCGESCCSSPQPWKPPETARLDSSAGFHVMSIVVPIGMFLMFLCIIGMCVAGIIRACKRRNSMPRFEAHPAAVAAPYPRQMWAPASMQMPAPAPAPMPMPMPMPVPVPAGAPEAFPAGWPSPAKPACDPPPPYHTVVPGATPPPPLASAPPC